MTHSISWCKLTTHGVLRFDGTDALSFLQGQLTNDVAALDPAHSHYSGYCTPKGRLLASLLLWREGSAYFMLLPRELCEPIRKRLSMYILRAKVTAQDVSASYALFGVAGEHAAQVVTPLTGAAPTAEHEVAHNDGITAIRLPAQRYLIVTDNTAAAGIETALALQAAASPPTLWAALDIEAGIATIVTATQEVFVPQMVNFDLIHALSFSKGCYPGQEIVARTRYLGKIKQRMLRARVLMEVADKSPAAGDKLYAATFGEQACGTIVSATPSADKLYDVLAVVHIAEIADTEVHWQSPDGPVLRFGDLPYPVT